MIAKFEKAHEINKVRQKESGTGKKKERQAKSDRQRKRVKESERNKRMEIVKKRRG